MKITIQDIQRAINNSGNVTTFSELYQSVLVNPPLDIASRLDLELSLPSPEILVQKLDNELSKLLTGHNVSNSNSIPPSNINLTITTAPSSGKKLSRYLRDIIETICPDIIALNIDPLSMSADMRYAFSLPCAVGYSCTSEIRSSQNRAIYSKLSFSPAGLPTVTILNGWLKGIPVLPLGKHPAVAQLTYVPSQGYVDLTFPENARWQDEISAAEQVLDERLEGFNDASKEAQESIGKDLLKNASGSQRDRLLDESCYFISRLMDLLIFEKAQGKNPRVLIVSDLAHYHDICYLSGLLRDGITDEIYVDAKTAPDYQQMVLDGVNQVYLENENLDGKGVSEGFLKKFNDWVEQRRNETLTDEQGLKLAVSVAERTRHHPDITRGISVRGTIALIEVLRGLVLIRGNLTREAVGRAALITFPPRMSMKEGCSPTDVLTDILKEVFYDFSFESDNAETAIRSLNKLSGGDILDKLNQIGQLPQEGSNLKGANSAPTVVPENENNKNILKKLEQMNFLKKGQNGQYKLTQKALQTMLDQLDKKLEAKEISPEEYQRQKARLQNKMKSLNQPRFKMTSKELANTIMELIDAQDRQWNKDINFQTMRTYYHIKENSEGADLGDEKKDYYSLQKLIDDLEKRKILAAAGSSSGLLLTGLALDMLLKYFLEDNRSSQQTRALIGSGKTKSSERSQEIRRFSSGDAFRDIAIRPTLREIARQKRNLKEIRNSDLKVFLKQPRKPQSDIVICMDTSGSMGFHQKLLYARLAAAGLIQSAIREKNRIGLVAFNDSGQITIPLTVTGKDMLLNCVAGLNARGNTNIGEGIKTSRNMLFKDFSSNQKYIILISDGQPTALSESAFSKLKGREEKDLTEESAILETRAASDKGIQLSVIHIAGEGEANEKFVKNIAHAGNGKIRRISGPGDFKGFMS